MIIRAVEPSDALAWEVMRRELWPEDPESHPCEIAAFFAGTLAEPQAVLVAQGGKDLVAVEELSIRRDLGWVGREVAYVEGLYVKPAFRGRDIARKLLTEGKAWAKRNHCDAFASDRSDRVIIDPHY